LSITKGLVRITIIMVMSDKIARCSGGGFENSFDFKGVGVCLA